MLLNIGDGKMTISELLWRGCYLGTNVTYNLKRLTETGYVIQTRSENDRRVIMVRASEKGAALCQRLQDMNERHIAALAQGSLSREDAEICRRSLRILQRYCSQVIARSPVETECSIGATVRPTGPSTPWTV
jgi:DNA-binding MarR family transcriptional regulator